jgi:hypothetical protein
MHKPDDLTHQEMPEWVIGIARFIDNTYGERRMQKALNSLSSGVSRRKAAGVCVRTKKKYKATTHSDHKKPIYNNLLKQEFVTQKPAQAWAQDINHV